MWENIVGALRDGLSLVVTFVPKLLLFLVILLIGWLLAKALRKAVNAILERVGFDRAVERGGVGRALASSKYDASDLVAALVYYAILLITLQLAFGAFGPNPISDLLAGIVAFLPSLAVAIIIVVVAAAIAAAVKDLITGAMGGLSYGKVLANIASIFVIGLGVIAALSQIGIAVAVTLPVLVTVLATVGGILIVGVGGGLIAPMRQRWERVLTHAEQEAPKAAAHAQANAGQATANLETKAQTATGAAPRATDGSVSGNGVGRTASDMTQPASPPSSIEDRACTTTRGARRHGRETPL